MSIEVLERELEATKTLLENDQLATPSILLITKGAGHNIENAFQMAHTTGLRLVIALWPDLDEKTRSVSNLNPQEVTGGQDCQTILADLTDAAHQHGIREVMTYEQECWGEDEFDDLVKLENSQYTLVAL